MFFFLSTEVTVALSETSFPVSEETGSPLRVCARVSGSLGRSVSVGVVAVDNTAVGELIHHLQPNTDLSGLKILFKKLQVEKIII